MISWTSSRSESGSDRNDTCPIRLGSGPGPPSRRTEYGPGQAPHQARQPVPAPDDDGVARPGPGSLNPSAPFILRPVATSLLSQPPEQILASQNIGTTYRLTEHHSGCTPPRNVPSTAELQPEGFQAEFKRLLNQAGRRVRFHGPYRSPELPTLMRRARATRLRPGAQEPGTVAAGTVPAQGPAPGLVQAAQVFVLLLSLLRTLLRLPV